MSSAPPIATPLRGPLVRRLAGRALRSIEKRFETPRAAASPLVRSTPSAPWSFACDLHPLPQRYCHDSIFDITASARIPAVSPHVCPRPPWGCETPQIHLPTTGRNAHRPNILPIVSFPHSFRNSKYIARRFHIGFLQVAVSKTHRRSWRSAFPETLHAGSFPIQH